MHIEPEIRSRRQRHRLLISEPTGVQIVETCGQSTRRLHQLDRELRAESLIERVVHWTGRRRATATGGSDLRRIRDRNHLEPITVVEISLNNRAGRVETRAGKHDEARPVTRTIVDTYPDTFIDTAGGVLGRGFGGASDRKQGEKE